MLVVAPQESIGPSQAATGVRVHLISSWSRDLTCHSISVIIYNTHRPVWTVLALTHLPCASGGSTGKYRTIAISHGPQRVHSISSWSRDFTCHSISVIIYNTHRPVWTVLALTHLLCASGGSTGKYRTITISHGPQRVHSISSWSRDFTCHSISVIIYNTHRPVWTVLALTHLPCASGGSTGKYRTITSSHGRQSPSNIFLVT